MRGAVHLSTFAFFAALGLTSCGKAWIDRSASRSELVSNEIPADAPPRPVRGGLGVSPVGGGSPVVFRLDYFRGHPGGQTEADRKRLEWWVDENFSSPLLIQVCNGNSSGTCRSWLRVSCQNGGCSIEALQGEFEDYAYLTPGVNFRLAVTHYLPIGMRRFALTEWAFEVLPEDTSVRMAEAGSVQWAWGNLLAN
jgi:hypothetical protein